MNVLCRFCFYFPFLFLCLIYRRFFEDIYKEDLNRLLFTAIHLKSYKILELLLRDGAHVDTRDRYGHTPLMLASSYGYASLVELLLEKGADHSIIHNDLHNTALHFAIPYSNVVSVLLEGGADATLSREGYLNPLKSAKKQNMSSYLVMRNYAGAFQ